MNELEQRARALITDEGFEVIAKRQGFAAAVRAAEVRLYAEQHQARAFWELAKAVAK